MGTQQKVNIYHRYIKEDYKIGETIGQGSFATVKKCKNKATGNRYAVKVITKSKLQKQDEDIFTLQNEINVLSQLDHPNVVRLFEVFNDEKFLCMVQEHMKGGTLYDMIKERHHLSESESREAAITLFNAIQYCH